MKKINILIGFLLGFGLLLGSCTDDLDQMPVTETTSNDVYSQPENYKKVLAKIYASYVLAGQGQGGDNGDLTTINGQDFPVDISTFRRPLLMKWQTHGCLATISSI